MATDFAGDPRPQATDQHNGRQTQHHKTPPVQTVRRCTGRLGRPANRVALGHRCVAKSAESRSCRTRRPLSRRAGPDDHPATAFAHRNRGPTSEPLSAWPYPPVLGTRVVATAGSDRARCFPANDFHHLLLALSACGICSRRAVPGRLPRAAEVVRPTLMPPRGCLAYAEVTQGDLVPPANRSMVRWTAPTGRRTRVTDRYYLQVG